MAMLEPRRRHRGPVRKSQRNAGPLVALAPFIWPVVIGGAAVVGFGLWQARQGIVEVHNAPESEAGKVAVSIALPIAIIAVAVIILISIGRR